MSFEQFKTIPHVIKPFSLFLIILQMIFLFCPNYRAFGWFVMVTTILMLIVCFLVFVAFAVEASFITQAPMWPLAEMIYAAVFCICSGVNSFYFFVNIFHKFNFLFVLGTASSVLLFVIFGFDAFFWYRERMSPSSSFNSSNNQATAQPGIPPSTGYPFPSGANPA